MFNRMRLVNLTPHVLNVHRVDGTVLEVQPSGTVARVSSTPTVLRTVDGVEIKTTVFGEVQNLPEPQEGVLLVVSGIVRDRVPTRTDVASPGELVRDATGQPAGCKGLVVNG